MISILLKLSACLGLAYYVLLISWTTCELTTEAEVVEAQRCLLGPGSCSEAINNVIYQTFPCFGPSSWRALEDAQLCDRLSATRFERRLSSGARFSCVLFGHDNIKAAFRLGAAAQRGPGPFPTFISDVLTLHSLVPEIASQPYIASILSGQSDASFVQSVAAHAALAFAYALEFSLVVAIVYFTVRISTEFICLTASALLTSSPWGSLLPSLLFRNPAAHDSQPESPPAPRPPAFTDRVPSDQARLRDCTREALQDLALEFPAMQARFRHHAELLELVKATRDAGGAPPASLRDPDVHLAPRYWSALAAALLAYATLEWGLPLYQALIPTVAFPPLQFLLANGTSALATFAASSRAWLRGVLTQLAVSLAVVWPEGARWLFQEHELHTLDFLHVLLLVGLPSSLLIVSYKLLAGRARRLQNRDDRTLPWDRRLTLARLRWGFCAAGVLLGYRQSWHMALALVSLALFMEWGVAREDATGGPTPLGLPGFLSSGITVGGAVSQLLWVPGLAYPSQGLDVPARDVLLLVAEGVGAAGRWLRDDALDLAVRLISDLYASALHFAHGVLANAGIIADGEGSARVADAGDNLTGNTIISSASSSSPVTGNMGSPGVTAPAWSSISVSVPATLFLLFVSARFWWSLAQLRRVAAEHTSARAQGGEARGALSAVYACIRSPVLAVGVAEGLSLLLLACLPHKGIALACMSLWPFLVQGRQGRNPRLPGMVHMELYGDGWY